MEINQILEKMITVVKGCGEIIRNAEEDQMHASSKSSFRDLVTQYDVRVQEYAIEELAKAFPGAGFISEESDAVSPDPEQMIFVIDPIDGTANFVHHYRHSCTSIACVRDHEPIAAVIYDPYKEELFCAGKGEGAFLNGKRLMIPENTLAGSLVLFGSAPYYPELTDKTFEALRSVFGRCQDVRRSGSAALDLCYVAAGRAGLFYETMLSVWDYAAGALIIREAGGVCVSMEGTEPVFDRQAKGSIIAGSERIIQESGLTKA
ncbi:MAG: inositol monophosphatase [Parasporobacterium sp.]|nr:inositol monophosphatase [Parasporobacterium sp.]